MNINTLITGMVFAANKKKDKTATPTPEPTPDPTQTPDTPTDTTSDEGPILQAFDWVMANPIPVLVIAGIIGLAYGWRQLRNYNMQRGKATPPLGFILKRAIRFAIIEDKKPLITKPANLAPKLKWLQWRMVYALLAGITIALYLAGRSDLIIGTAIISLILYFRARGVFRRRHNILMQMFNVAASDFRYPKGSELNPWAYINVTKWIDLYRPGQTIVTYPAGYQSEDLNARERFERNFSGSVSDENSFTYEWKSAQNRVIATPTPYLPATAKYPGRDDHPWNEFPLGITWGGEEAIWSIDTCPHALIAGPTGSGKATTLSTKIPTPYGWVTMGEIQVGDEILDEQGQPTRVTWVGDINENPDLYEVEFSDGSVISADADHLWWTETRSARQSRWDESRRNAERRCLLSSDALDSVTSLLQDSSLDDEITLADFAQIAGVSETSPWLREVADEIGPAGEVQIVSTFEYAQQAVTQKQTAYVFNAREAWTALANYKPKTSRWFPHREVIAERLAQAGPVDEVSSGEIASLLECTKKDAGNVLAANHVYSIRREGGGRLAESFYPAEAAWKAFLMAAERGVPDWMVLQPKFAYLADQSDAEDVILGRDIAEFLGFSRNVEGAKLLHKLGVQSERRSIDVILNVPEKAVVRGGRIARTYLSRLLAERVLERVQRPAHDQRHLQTTGSVKTTVEILKTLRDQHGYANHSIPVAKPLALPEVALPIPPYTLGAWLGDGNSRKGEVCGIDWEVMDHMKNDGFLDITAKTVSPTVTEHPDFRLWKSTSLRSKLNAIGLIQKNTQEGSKKRIPEIYLRSSIEQRKALLAGLLDTDGTVAPQGTVQFTNTNELLAYQVLELARSLGYRPTLSQGVARLDGREIGPKFTISWTCKESPFWLTRKTQAHAERNMNFSEERNGSRFIVNIRKVAPEPARCIAVDAPSRLFLAGEGMIPTHNSVVQRTILLHALQSPKWRVIGIDPKMVELGPYKHHKNVVRIATTLEDSVSLLDSAEAEMKKRYEDMERQGVNHFMNLPPDPETGQELPALLIMVDETYALLAPEGIKSDEGKERDAMHARCTVAIGSIARLGRAAGVHLVLATQRPDAKVLPGETRNNLDARIACARMDTTPSLMVLDSDHATRLPLIKGRSVLRLGGDVKEYQGYFVPIEQVDGIVQRGLARANAEMFGADFEDAQGVIPPFGEDEGDAGGDLGLSLSQAGPQSRQRPAGKPGKKGKPAKEGKPVGGLKGLWAKLEAKAQEQDEDLARVQGLDSGGAGSGSVVDGPVEEYWGSDPHAGYESEDEYWGSGSRVGYEADGVVGPRTTESGFPLEEPEDVVEPRTRPVSRTRFGSVLPDPVPMGEPMDVPDRSSGPVGATGGAVSPSDATRGWYSRMAEEGEGEGEELIDYGFESDDEDSYPVDDAPYPVDDFVVPEPVENPVYEPEFDEYSDVDALVPEVEPDAGVWMGNGSGWGQDDVDLSGLMGGRPVVPPVEDVPAPPSAPPVPPAPPVEDIPTPPSAPPVPPAPPVEDIPTPPSAPPVPPAQAPRALPVQPPRGLPVRPPVPPARPPVPPVQGPVEPPVEDVSAPPPAQVPRRQFPPQGARRRPPGGAPKQFPPREPG